jgi:translation initiation factor IF-2
LQQQKEKVRIFALARELGMESKDLVVLCKQHNIDVKSQLSTIEPEVRDQIVELVKRGKTAAPAPASPAPATPIAQPTQRRVPTLTTIPARTASQAPAASPALSGTPSGPTAPTVTPPVAVPPAAARPPVTPATPPVAESPRPATPPVPPAAAPTATVGPTQAPRTPAVPPATPPAAPVVPPQEKQPIPVEKTIPPVAPAAKQPEHPAAPKAPDQPAPARQPDVPPETRPAAGPQAPPTAEPPRPAVGPGVPNLQQRPMRSLTPPRPGPGAAGTGGSNQGGERRPQHPAIRQHRTPSGPHVAPPPTSKQAKPPEQKPAAQQPGGARKLANIPQELLQQMQGGGAPPSVTEIERRLREQQQPSRPGGTPGGFVAPMTPAEIEDDEGTARRRGTAGGVPGRADRHKGREERAKRKAQGEDSKGGKISASALLEDERERHRKHRKPKIKAPITEKRKGKIPVSVPITVRALSEALGKKSGEILLKMVAHGQPTTTTINSFVEPDMAEMIALEYGFELDIKREVDLEQDVIDIHARKDAPEDLVPRAPVVTIMGHVDHGKTSLLDRIRNSNIVDTEAGGITQVIRAWRVEHNGRPITFLDTPGHEAFTKMRARGANVTDIVVIVVAANDGVMPQTEEAISHAKAAGVSIVVAINKVDLPDANLKKTEQQLYSLELIPDNMGGDVPFVYTSAKTGKGIDELLEALSVVAELKELKANPNKAASGTCLEAYLSEKEGVYATILVQDGTLRPGDVVLCGAAYGSVRRMYDDRGRPLEEAGPSVPVRITGLDEVPNADDPFLVVKDLATAREIAETRKSRAQAKALHTRKPVTIESLKDAEIAELKVILKAEARGSIEAIRAELEKLYHDEVRVRILHAAIGGITASDVQLALTSPEDTLIIGFNAVPDDAAKALADERGIQIREYNIIYKLADDIRSALEGKLKPREDVIHLGRAVVRAIYKISRVGTIAGCHVTQGVIERSAKVRVIRAGVVVYPPADRTVGLDSLKRFKEDAREVREGFECGIKISGYDDVKVDDVIECYRIEQVQRTLS